MRRKNLLHRWKKITLLIICSLILCLCATFSGGADTESEKDHEKERQEAIDRMRQGLESFEQVIDISDLSITPAELGELFSHATKDTPYLFYVSNNLSYTYRAGGHVVAVKPKYIMDKEEASEALEFCRGEIKRIAELVLRIDGEENRLIAVHDLICREYSYDLTLTSNNLYSFLKEKKGTCQGYTWAYMAILREMGIECRYVASDTIAHIWLAVKIDGEWYHSDVTWDDPPSGEGSGDISRRHLLFSDEKADKDGYADRYSSEEIKCKSKIYDNGEKPANKNSCILAGDVDHDGMVSMPDLLYFRQYTEKGIDPKQICPICADRDKNYVLNEQDAELIRQVIMKKS